MIFKASFYFYFHSFLGVLKCPSSLREGPGRSGVTVLFKAVMWLWLFLGKTGLWACVKWKCLGFQQNFFLGFLGFFLCVFFSKNIYSDPPYAYIATQ